MKIKGHLLCLILFFSTSILAQSLGDAEKIKLIDSLMRLGEEKGVFPGLAIAYCSNDTSWTAAYGKRSWNGSGSVQDGSLFQLGSIGKVLTAIAVLQQVENGNLRLDQDVKTYLPWFETSNTVTLLHLLTHSAGLNDKNVGYLARDSASLQELGDHLRAELPTFHQDAGLEINYSNYSYALAGHLVEVSSNVAFSGYVKAQIFNPLGMEDSYVGFDHNYKRDEDYALGHKANASGFEENEEFPRHATPAGSFTSSAIDMQKLVIAIIQQDTSILSKESWDLMFTRQFSNHPLLGGYSLGFEEQTVAGHTFWAKGGMLFGYLSQLVIFPDSTGLFIAANTNDDAFLEQFHASFQEVIFKKVRSAVSASEVPDLGDYAGEYRNGRYDRDGVENLISLFRGAFEIWEGSSGLLAYHNGEMHTYLYQGDDLFVNATNPDQKLVFSRDSDGVVSRLYRNVNIGGLDVPSTFEKTRWYNSPTFMNEYYGVIPLAVVTYSISLIFVFMIWLIRLRKPKFWRWRLLPKGYYFVAALAVLGFVLHSSKAIMYLIKSTAEFLFGLPKVFILYNNISYFIVVVSIVMVFLSCLALLNRKGSLVSRVLFCIVTICLSVHAFYLWMWNFI